MHIARATATLLILIAFTSAADGTDIVTLSGSSARILPEGAGSVRFPARFAEAPAVDVVEVTFDGTPARPDGFSASIDPQGFLVLGATAEAARDAGTYAVVVRARAATGLAQLIALNVIRPAGELRLGSGSPIRIDRTVYFPGIDTTSTDAVTINAVGRRVAVTPSQRLWTADLRRGDNTVVGQVRMETPRRISGQGNALAAIEVLGHPPLGTASSTLRVAAPQLAAGAVEQPVEVISRLTSWWLLFVILIGIFVGHLVRNVLETRRLRADALLAADAERSELLGLIRRTADAEDVTALEEVVGTLESVMRDQRRSPEEIRAAAEAAKREAAKTVSAANEIRAMAAGQIAELQATLGTAEAHVTPIADIIGDLLARLEEQRQALAAGDSRSVNEAIADLRGMLETALEPALTTWAAEVRDALDRLSSWPEAPSVAAGVASAHDMLQKLAASNDLHARLESARQLATTVGADLFGVGRSAVVRPANAALDSLPPESPVAQTARKAVAKIERWSGEPAGAAMRELVDAFVELRDAIDEARRARDAAQTPVHEKALGEPAARKTVTQLPTLEFTATAAPAPPAVARLTMAGALVADRPLSFRIVSATARPLQRIRRVTWTVGGTAIASGNALMLTYTPPEAQFLAVRAEIEFDDGAQTAADLSVQIAPAPRALSSEQLLATRRAAESIQTAVAGVLIAVGGMLIFRSSFVGTFEDLAAAFLWGFATDVGLARVRELSLPILQRTIPGQR